MAPKKNKKIIFNTVKADPSQWSGKSKNSLAYEFTQTYKDIKYNCRYCNEKTMYSAKEQKYQHEIKKVHIDKTRVLCNKCWKKSLKVKKDLRNFENKWNDEKNSLKSDADFMNSWHELLLLQDIFKPCKSNTAIKNMLTKLLKKIPNE
ncbi:hypothetical protein MNBD_GAMMA09-1762 [hydrothermal vent metagenome]|uniref:Probable zinc-binding domain-containing protein n=1 Tax=hydrothermal vent metagenome TaxID=652676 RepID=A0A3B0XU25_9ZZZZ